MNDWYFYVDDEIENTTLKAAVTNQSLQNIPLCPLAVGDTFCFPGSLLAYRVVSRHLQPSQDGTRLAWAMKIESTENPMTS